LSEPGNENPGWLKTLSAEHRFQPKFIQIAVELKYREGPCGDMLTVGVSDLIIMPTADSSYNARNDLELSRRQYPGVILN
jgi:hypothetical protein